MMKFELGQKVIIAANEHRENAIEGVILARKEHIDTEPLYEVQIEAQDGPMTSGHFENELSAAED